MIRRRFAGSAAAVAAALVAPALSACGGTGDEPAKAANGPTPTVGKVDAKSLAPGLATKTDALITAINAKDNAQITKAKSDLSKECDKAEDALKSETGQAANQVNAAVTNIRAAMFNNNVARLTSARDQLKSVQ